MTILDSHQWIYDLVSQPDEQIYYNCQEWLLAKDKHPGTDTRYLIIFKDRNLRTLRDLRDGHISLLREARDQSYTTLAKIMRLGVKQIAMQWRIYFHYYPSVFQLHAHIVNESVHRNADRVHDLKHVIRNLMFHPTWYRDATILCSQTRFLTDVLEEISLHQATLWARIVKGLLRIELNFGISSRKPKDPVETNLPAADPCLPANVSFDSNKVAWQEQEQVTAAHIKES